MSGACELSSGSFERTSTRVCRFASLSPRTVLHSWAAADVPNANVPRHSRAPVTPLSCYSPGRHAGCSLSDSDMSPRSQAPDALDIPMAEYVALAEFGYAMYRARGLVARQVDPVENRR